MPYPFLTFSDLYAEEKRSSQPPSPVMGAASLPSPVFLLPMQPQSYQHSPSSSHAPSPTASSSPMRRSSTMASTSSQSSSAEASRRKGLSIRSWALKAKTSSSRSTSPASSCRSSLNGDAFFPSSTSSGVTTPAISRVNSKLNDFEAYVERTKAQEAEDEEKMKREIDDYFAKAAGTELSLRRF